MNALCWVSKVKVPADGFGSDTVDDEEIALNLDDKGRKKKGY